MKEEIKKETKYSKEYISAMLLEYEQCFNNYIYRDQLAPHEFYLSLVIVGTIVGIMEVFQGELGYFGTILMFIIGLIALHILHIDLMNNASCKKAAIDRALEIENKLGQDNNSKIVLQLAHKIGNRKKYALEKWLKKSASSSYLMIWFIRFLTGIWIVYWIRILVY